MSSRSHECVLSLLEPQPAPVTGVLQCAAGTLLAVLTRPGAVLEAQGAGEFRRCGAHWSAGGDATLWEVKMPSGGGSVQLAATAKGFDTIRATVLSIPTVTVHGAEVAPDALSVKTLLTRCMGALARWDHLLSAVAAQGYNAVHLSPVQTLGASGSAYCVANHSQLSPSLDATWEQVSAFFKTRLRGELGLLVMTDVVWNHVASDCPWLHQHPECGYSVSLDADAPVNSPHLAPALDLDLALQRASQQIQSGLVPDVPTTVTCEKGNQLEKFFALSFFHSPSFACCSDVQAVLAHVSGPLWQQLRLWEYFVLSEEALRKAHWVGFRPRAAGTFDELLERIKTDGFLLHRHVGRRFGWTVDLHRVMCQFDTEEEYRRCLMTLNLHLHRRVDALKV